MSWKFGALFIDQSFKENEPDLVESLFPSCKSTSLEVTVSEALRGSLDGIAVGYWNDKTIIAANILAYECISELSYLEKSTALKRVEEYSEDADILCVYLHSSAGIFGDCVYSKEHKIASHFFHDGDLSSEISNEELPAWYKEGSKYSEDTLFKIINGFLGIPFPQLLANNRFKMNVYHI